jgi:hypothetical protein
MARDKSFLCRWTGRGKPYGVVLKGILPCHYIFCALYVFKCFLLSRIKKKNLKQKFLKVTRIPGEKEC